VDAGRYNNCGLKTDGSINCWGNDFAGIVSTAPPASETDFAAVSMGEGGDHVCALKTDSTLFCWGADDDGKASPPATALTESYPQLSVMVQFTGLARNGIDYITVTSPVVVPAGESSATFTITPIQDLFYEGSEDVVATIQPDAANYTVDSPSSATVTISDDETASTLPSGSGTGGAFTSCTGTASATCNLGISPDRVRKNNSAVVTWWVDGLIVGENGKTGTSCSIIRSPDDATFPVSSTANAGSWQNTTGISSVITSATTFTLSCASEDGTTRSVSKNVTLLPSIIEI
jgi:hypothetical protein